MDAAGIVREARRRAGLKQTDLARRLGTIQSAVARWESGAVSPRVDTLERLVRACGLDVALLLVSAPQDDRDQIAERLGWTPGERLEYLTSMVAFEEHASQARQRRHAAAR
jgi:transcriptional regulator with XRE-family HTH domain